MSKDYREIAEHLGVKYLFGRWGIAFLSKDPDGNIYKLVSFIPLDGWITDPKEIYKEMKKRDFKL